MPDHPDDHDPPRTYRIACDRCHETTEHSIAVTGGGYGSLKGPPDPIEYAAICTRCRHVVDLPELGECPRCEGCGNLMPELYETTGPRVCDECLDAEMDAAIAGLGGGLMLFERAAMREGARWTWEEAEAAHAEAVAHLQADAPQPEPEP